MNTHDIKVTADGAAVTVAATSVMGWLTPTVALIGSLLTIVWMCIRIYETDTVQKIVHRNKKDDDDASNKS